MIEHILSTLDCDVIVSNQNLRHYGKRDKQTLEKLSNEQLEAIINLIDLTIYTIALDDDATNNQMKNSISTAIYRLLELDKNETIAQSWHPSKYEYQVAHNDENRPRRR